MSQSRFTERLRQDHALRKVVAADGKMSMVLLTDEERREEAASLIDLIASLHGPREYGPRCKSCVELHPCETFRIIHSEER